MSHELIWKCLECDGKFTSYPDENDTNPCPCGESFVDHSEHYFRIVGNVEVVTL